jgi:beta-lactamase regulating signal transducer with metallopeptidase domain
MLWWIVETTLVAAALAVVATLLPRLRPLGPAARHALWLVVLVKLMTPPLLSWPWPVFTPAQIDTAPGTVILDPQIANFSQEPNEPAGSDGASTVRAHLPREGATALLRWALVVWFVGAATLASLQLLRIVGFRRRLRGAVPAPTWLVAEAARLGGRLGVRVPQALAVPGLGTPVVWCPGPPRLLLPSRLLETLKLERWRGILVHELAHLRRGDHWVRWLAVVAGWVWWWNPLYWIARRRIDDEAELACDAWVVWALPDDRIVYAETLLDICASLATAKLPSRTAAPALGVTSSGRFFERRLTMILSDRVNCRLSVPGFLGVGLLVLLALPSWIVAQTATRPDQPAVASDEPALVARPIDLLGSSIAFADDDPDDDQDASDEKATKPKAAKNKKPTKNDPSTPDDPKGKDKTRAAIEKALSEIEKALGTEVESIAKLQRLRREIDEALKEKLGPGSEFEARMKEFGRRMEKQFGPDSEFEARMKEFGQRMEKQFGPDSDFARRMKEKMKESGELDRVPSAKEKPNKPKPERAPRPSPRNSREVREKRIRDLESRLNEIQDELKRLKADDREQEDEDDARRGENTKLL